MTLGKKPIEIHWLAFLVFIGIGFLGYLMKAVDGFHSTPGDLIDARFNSVILEHLYNWLKGGLSGHWTDIWSPGFFYPYPNVLAFSDNHFGSALPYILLRQVGFSRELSFSGWYVMGFCLNFFCSYWVLRRFQFSVFAASAAAFVFTFALPVIAQDGHSQFSYRFAIPLAFLALWNVVNTLKLRFLAILSFWVSVQFFCSIYTGVFLALFLFACYLPMLALRQKGVEIRLYDSHDKQNLPHGFYLLLLSLSVFASLALAFKYQMVSQQYGFTPDTREITQMIPRLESYLIADRSPLSRFIGHALATNLALSPYRSEHQLFIGMGVMLFLMVGTYVTWTSKASEISKPNLIQIQIGKIAFIALLILFLGTLTYGIGSIWMQLNLVPGLKFLRAITRVILVMIFPISILLAIACEKLYLSTAFEGNYQKIALIIGTAILLCSETVFFHNSKTPNEDWAKRMQVLERDLPKPLDQNSILFVVKDEAKPGYELPEVDAMIFAQDHGMPTVNGYSGKFPPGNIHNPVERCIKAQERLEAYARFTGVPLESTIPQLMKKIIKTPNIPCGSAQ